MNDDLNENLKLLVHEGVIPVLHHTPLCPGYTEDPNDPEPRWCCHDERDETFHAHGYFPDEAVNDLLRMIEHGSRPNPERYKRSDG